MDPPWRSPGHTESVLESPPCSAVHLMDAQFPASSGCSSFAIGLNLWSFAIEANILEVLVFWLDRWKKNNQHQVRFLSKIGVCSMITLEET